MNKLGKEHFKISRVQALSGVIREEAKTRVEELTRQAEPKPEQHTEAQPERQPEPQPEQHTEPQPEPQQEQHTEPQQEQQAQEVQVQAVVTPTGVDQGEPQTEPHEEPVGRDDYISQKYLGRVHDALFPLMESWAMYTYLERYNIDHLELLSKYLVIERVLMHPTLSLRKKHEIVQSALSSLKKHLEMLYINHAIQWSRLCRRDQIT